MMRSMYAKRDVNKYYFTLPNQIFDLGLHYIEVAIFAYLLRIEYRKTFECVTSYPKIAQKLGLSVNTVAKYVVKLEEHGLIRTEHTDIITRDGLKRNGCLRYTILPIQNAVDLYHERQLTKAELAEGEESEKPPETQIFEPVKLPRRRPGTGYVKQINDHIWEGRYSPIWPDGKKHSRNVYGRTREEVEAKLSDLILQMKAEIAALRSGKATEYPDGVSPKTKQLSAYLRENPGVSNKSYIARQLGMAITTVHKYYDEVREELAALAVP